MGFYQKLHAEDGVDYSEQLYARECIYPLAWSCVSLICSRIKLGNLKYFRMTGTPWSDGMPGLSQTPIEPGRSFIYRFPATPAGTYWSETLYPG
jgi:hypothetical protein